MSQPTIFDVIRALNTLTDAVRDMTKAVNEKEMSTFEQLYPPPGEELPKEESPKPITLEEIRGALAEKSRAGHSAEVKALIARHGADKLSGIDPKEYPAMMEELGCLHRKADCTEPTSAGAREAM